MQIWIFDVSSWLMWASLAVGAMVTVGIFWFSSVFWLRPRAECYADGELPWEQILDLLKSQQGADGQLPDEWNNLPPDQLLRLLQQRVRETPKPPAGSTMVDAGEVSYLSTGKQRRASRRRWLNPAQVSLTTVSSETPQQGLVINRSEGGIAILTDSVHQPGAMLFVRAADAPKYITSATVTVRHVRPAGKLWLIGCQYADDVPWNVKVWFG